MTSVGQHGLVSQQLFSYALRQLRNRICSYSPVASFCFVFNLIKMIWNINYIFVLGLLSAMQFVCRAKTIKKAGATLRQPLEDLSLWQGKWFPHAPGEYPKEKLQRMHLHSNEVYKSGDSWAGGWFPYAPGEQHILRTDPQVDTVTTPKIKDDWQGKWFPQAPGEPHITKGTHEEPQNLICDDGVVSS